jgi:hypothetical protein
MAFMRDKKKRKENKGDEMGQDFIANQCRGKAVPSGKVSADSIK